MLPPIGVWIDDPAHVALRAGYLDRLVEFGVTRVAVMVQRMPRGRRAEWRQTWSTRDLMRFASRCAQRGIALTLTIWPQPTAKALELAKSKLEHLIRQTGASGVELDAESNWTEKRLVGFAGDLYAAARAWRFWLEDLREEHGVRIELTTFPAHAENGGSGGLAPSMDLLLPQAYGVRHRRHRGRKVRIDFDGPLGPERIVERSLHGARKASAAARVPRAAVGVGLALYDQRFPGVPPVESLKTAFRAAVDGGAAEIRFWSSKWLLGVRAGKAAQDFLEWAAAQSSVV